MKKFHKVNEFRFINLDHVSDIQIFEVIAGSESELGFELIFMLDGDRFFTETLYRNQFKSMSDVYNYIREIIDYKRNY